MVERARKRETPQQRQRQGCRTRKRIRAVLARAAFVRGDVRDNLWLAPGRAGGVVRRYWKSKVGDRVIDDEQAGAVGSIYQTGSLFG